MRVLAEEAWSWMLFGDGSDLYLSVLCGSVAQYAVDFRLSLAESEQFHHRGASYIADLAGSVRSGPGSFRERHIQSFDRLPSIKGAVGAWRTAKSAEA
jgi:hypothetical protein